MVKNNVRLPEKLNHRLNTMIKTQIIQQFDSHVKRY